MMRKKLIKKKIKLYQLITTKIIKVNIKIILISKFIKLKFNIILVIKMMFKRKVNLINLWNLKL